MKNNFVSEYLAKENENTNSERYSTPVLTAAFIMIAKIWDQTKCPSLDEWIKKMWFYYVCVCVCLCVCIYIYIYIYIYIMEYCSSIINEVLLTEAT